MRIAMLHQIKIYFLVWTRCFLDCHKAGSCKGPHIKCCWLCAGALFELARKANATAPIDCAPAPPTPQVSSLADRLRAGLQHSTGV